LVFGAEVFGTQDVVKAGAEKFLKTGEGRHVRACPHTEIRTLFFVVILVTGLRTVLGRPALLLARVLTRWRSGTLLLPGVKLVGFVLVDLGTRLNGRRGAYQRVLGTGIAAAGIALGWAWHTGLSGTRHVGALRLIGSGCLRRLVGTRWLVIASGRVGPAVVCRLRWT